MSKIFDEMDRLAEEKEATKEGQVMPKPCKLCGYDSDPNYLCPSCKVAYCADCVKNIKGHCACGYSWTINAEESHNYFTRETSESKTSGLNIVEAVKMATPGDKIRRDEWVSGNFLEDRRIDIDDILADDWMIVPKVKKIPFLEAVKAVVEGKKVARESDKKRIYSFSASDLNLSVCWNNAAADDWIVMD